VPRRLCRDVYDFRFGRKATVLLCMESRSTIGDGDRDVMTDRSGFALVATVLTLLSGALMVLAGYVWHESGWSSAAWSAVAAGALILLAHAAARRADRGADPESVAPRRGRRPAAMATTLLSGAIMVLAGYAGSAWSWVLTPLLALVGGVVVVVAFRIDAK
jgi:peptidoglycan/LPS O-acetylase OafA/YrhL